jgi:hypothetical protein
MWYQRFEKIHGTLSSSSLISAQANGVLLLTTE